MTKTKHVVGWALAIGAATVCGCSGLPTTVAIQSMPRATDTGRHVRFTTTEFTRPNIDVSPDGREFYFDVLGEIYRAPIAGGEAEKLNLGGGWKSYPRLSRDGERIAFVSDKDDAAGIWGKRLDASGSVYFHAGATTSQAKGLAWLGNGQLASIHRKRRDAAQFTLAVSEVDGSGKRIAVDPVVLTRSRGLHLIGAAGDDESVYLFEERGSVVKADIKTGTTVPIMDHLPGPDFLFQQEGIVGQFRLSRDGRLMGYALAEGSATRLAIYDQTSRRHTVTACSLERSTDNGVQTLPYPTYAFLPDGKSVLLSRGGKFHRCSLGEGTTQEIAVSAGIDIALAPMAVRRADDPNRTQIRYPALDPKGNEIAFTAYGWLWKIGVDGRSIARVTQTGNEELMPAYSSDGTRLAYITQKDDVVALRVRDIASGRETIVIQSKEVAYANPAWSPDSRRIAYLEVDQRASLHSEYMIKFVDLQDGRSRLIGSTGPRTKTGHLYASPTWSTDGGGVYYIREGYSEETWQSVLELVHQTPGSAPTVLMTFGAAIDVVVSPDGRYAAVQDGLGISIMPLVASMTASPGEVRHVSLAELQTMRRIPAHGADYVLWTKDNHLLWSIQDEVFLSKDLSTAERLFKVTIPAAQTGADDIKVYVGGRVISMTNQGVIEDGAIVTFGRKIGYVGPASDVPSTFDSTMRIDVSGKTIVPGLIDVHMHRSFAADDFSSLTDHALFASAAYGVTTVYDPSLSMVKSAYLTDISRNDRYRGATFYGSGGILFGGKSDLNYVPIDSIEDARGYIDRLAKAGTPLVKSYERTSRRERKLIAQAALEARVGIASHEVLELGVQLGTVQDGYTSLEHTLTLTLNSAPVYSDVTGYLKGSGVSLTPTLVLFGESPKVLSKRTQHDTRAACLIEPQWTSTDAERMRRVPAGPELQDFARANIEEYARMLNDGLPVSIGGHNASPAGVFSHWEMWALALGGATPMNVLRAATVNGAIKLNMQDRIGSIAEGMDADFVVLNSNPLDDIYNTTDIARVVRRGHTLEWPEGAAFPQSWPVDADWDACQAWNLGIPRTDEQMQSVLN